MDMTTDLTKEQVIILIKDYFSKPREDFQLITNTKELVRIKITKSKVKCLTANFYFPQQFPSQRILIELKSKTLSQDFLSKLQSLSENELSNNIHDKPDIIFAIEFLHNFITKYPLCCCASEIFDLKEKFNEEEIKLNQKSSTIELKLQEELYYLNCSIFVPFDYPETQVGICSNSSNFPPSLIRTLTAHAKEVARKCVEPPLNKNKKDTEEFKVQESLKPVATFLINEIHGLPSQKCPHCNQLTLPTNPDEAESNESGSFHVERILCGHFYHLKCLLEFMKKPPFEGGKKCGVCGKRIFHEKYKVSPELSESRWAHQEARKREIQEVAEFLS